MAETGSSSAQQTPPQKLESAHTQEDREGILVDKDINVKDPILSVFDLHLVVKNILEQTAQGVDLMNICQSRLVSAVVPQVSNFPEMVG